MNEQHRVLWIAAICVTAASSTAAQNPDRPGNKPTITLDEIRKSDIIGRLGVPLGRIVVVEGIAADDYYRRLKIDMGHRLLRVQEVDGEQLDKEVVFHFRPWHTARIDKPAVGERFKFIAYESGGFIGVPHGAFKHVAPVAITNFHFSTSLTVLKEATEP